MRIAAALTAAALLAGCAPATRVTLLPPPEGKTSAVEVKSGDSPVVLSQPYESAALRNGALDVQQLDADRVQQRYGQILAEQPQPPERFMLHFDTGTTNLTPESISQLDQVFARASSRPGGEIFITGHTDSTGSHDTNDVLSLRRAQALRESFIQRGFDPLRVHAIGRGKREPIVPTADEVPEPRNRRVEIVVL